MRESERKREKKREKERNGEKKRERERNGEKNKELFQLLTSFANSLI